MLETGELSDPEIETQDREQEHTRICSECSSPSVDMGNSQISSHSFIHQCPRCSCDFCVHYASKVDFQFCIYCLHDFVMEDSIIRKVIESKSLTGHKTFTRVMRARHIMFKGQDWMFAQARVQTLSDQELADTIEYHRSIFGELLNEMEARKIARHKQSLTKMMRTASLKIPSVKTGFYTDGTPMPERTIGTDHTTVTTTTVKRTRISATQTNSTAVALNAIINVFKAQGLNQEQILAKLSSMAGGVHK